MSRKPVIPATEIGKCLRAIREKAGLSQAELAFRLGLNPERGQAYVSALEVGRVKHPEFPTVVAFIRACGAKWEEFCDLYDPPTVPEADTTEIDQTSFSESDKKQLKHKLRMEVYKYDSRTTRWVKGKPMAPMVQKQARKRFESCRSQASIIELAAKRMLDYEEFPNTDYVGYLLLARRMLSLLRRGKRPGQLEDMPTVLNLVEQWRLSPMVTEKLRAVAVEQYLRLTAQN
jgi:transcriptional regulator with XRE-family HTH domain